MQIGSLALNLTIYLTDISRGHEQVQKGLKKSPGTNASNTCNGEKGVLTFVHQTNQCTGSQGPSGLGYGPLTTTVWLLWASKVIAVGLLPTAVTQDVTSYASY